MPFDPSLPRPNTPLDADEMREQLNGLKTLVDAVPAGPPGEKGDAGEQGPAGSDGQPGTNGSPGADGRGIAAVRDSGDGTGRVIVELTDGSTSGPYTIATGPQGLPGEAGQQGPAGNDGGMGAEGPAGPEGRHVTNVRDNGDGRAVVEMSDGASYGPFWVSSGPPGSQGPAGNDGAPGAQGPAGNDGAPGEDGEVTTQQMTDAIGSAISGTSANTNAISLLNLTVSDPPTQSEMQTIANKMDELINALRR